VSCKQGKRSNIEGKRASSSSGSARRERGSLERTSQFFETNVAILDTNLIGHSGKRTIARQERDYTPHDCRNV
jgi:hypothetical protein